MLTFARLCATLSMFDCCAFMPLAAVYRARITGDYLRPSESMERPSTSFINTDSARCNDWNARETEVSSPRRSTTDTLESSRAPGLTTALSSTLIGVVPSGARSSDAAFTKQHAGILEAHDRQLAGDFLAGADGAVVVDRDLALFELDQAAERTATKWAPVLAATPPDQATRNTGSGFFTEGNNETGEWKDQKGWFWTGCFWVGELWLLYEKTGDEKFRRWAELWNAHLLGKESTQNHDVGFFNYYSSVMAYRATKDEPKYREGGFARPSV